MYIYGAGNIGKSLLNLLRNTYSHQLHQLNGYIDKNKNGSIENIPIIPLKNVNINAVIIIAIGDINTVINIQKELKGYGYNNVWWFVNRWKKYGKDFLYETCVSCKGWNGILLRQVEMHIMDACNLRCRGCTHFAPIFNNGIPDFSNRIDDVKNFSKKFGHIIRFVLLGGEPFLNPEIGKYTEEIRKILPDTQIEIVTNGLLIPDIKDTIFESIKRNHIQVSISEYEPTHKIIDRITDKLEKHEISYEVRRFEKKKKFNIPLSLISESKYEKKCISNGCITIWNGKMSRCPTLMYVSEFNKVFKRNLPEHGIISISDAICGEELINRFKEKVPLCDYCVLNECDWSICDQIAKCSDFATED